MTRLFNVPTFLTIAALIILLPILQRPVVAAEVLTLGIAALALNLLLGYTGLLSFGHAMFFGIGAYCAGILAAKYGLSAFVAIPIAMVVTAAISWLIGLVCVRRSGLYFIMITLAFNQMFYFIAYSWTSMTGGEDGLPGLRRPSIIADQWSFYIFTVIVFLITIVLMKRFVDSPTGRILQAIRDNPARAAATGYNVERYKLIAFVISGLFTGLAGAIFAFVFEIVPIDKINLLFSGDILFMTLIGGSASFIGPLIGAAFYTWLQETVSLYWDRWPMVLGIVFALVVLFFRTGIVGMADALGQKVLGERVVKTASKEATEARQ
jgi:branched-chain amino acid transport system permease protein